MQAARIATQNLQSINNDCTEIFWFSLASILQRFGTELKGNVTYVVLSDKSLVVKIG